MMHSMVAVVIIGIQWPLFGYSLARCKVLLVGAAATVSCPKQSLAGGCRSMKNIEASLSVYGRSGLQLISIMEICWTEGGIGFALPGANRKGPKP